MSAPRHISVYFRKASAIAWGKAVATTLEPTALRWPMSAIAASPGYAAAFLDRSDHAEIGEILFRSDMKSVERQSI
jgi:hypothetical protein